MHPSMQVSWIYSTCLMGLERVMHGFFISAVFVMRTDKVPYKHINNYISSLFETRTIVKQSILNIYHPGSSPINYSDELGQQLFSVTILKDNAQT